MSKIITVEGVTILISEETIEALNIKETIVHDDTQELTLGRS